MNLHTVDFDKENLEYLIFLKNNDLVIRETSFFIQANEPFLKQGWIINISLNPYEMDNTIKLLLPLLKEHNISFKFVKNRILHKDFNNGEYGQAMIGRDIYLYLDDTSSIPTLIPKLRESAKDLTGPKINFSYQIGKQLYVRYGSFDSNTITDEWGNLHRVIMDNKGRWIKDKYEIQPELPSGLDNPFQNYIRDTADKGFETPLLGIYEIEKTLTHEIWGNIYKGSYENSSNEITPCIIYRGKKGILWEESNRDVTDRLNWMATALRDLEGCIPIPQVIKYWKTESLCFLVLSSVDGKNLKFVSKEILKKRTWNNIDETDKLKLLRYALDLSNLLISFHQKGYIHRNLSWENIIVMPNDTLYLVAWDHSFNIKSNLPMPPFTGGQAGFASSDQITGLSPKYEDDVYSFGIILLSLLTGMSPTSIISDSDTSLNETIAFLIDNQTIVTIINDCISKKVETRPQPIEISKSLKQIIGESELSRKKVNTQMGITRPSPTKEQLEELLISSINSISDPIFTYNNLWFSQVDNQYDIEVYPLRNKHTLANFYQGLSGPIYLLNKSFKANFNISSSEKTLESAFSFIDKQIFSNLNRIPTSLYYGSSGIAIMLSLCLSTGLLPQHPSYKNILETFLTKSNKQQNVFYGSAGNGLALFQCQDFISKSAYIKQITSIASQLMQNQEISGCWRQENTYSQNLETINGFGYGIAGIVYFLLEYGHRLNSNEAILRSHKGLAYLSNNKIEDNSTYYWPISNSTKKPNIWWCSGSSGIALTFLKSYEYTGEIDHLSLAVRTLRYINTSLIHSNLGQCHGLSGLGEVYLEAYRITQSEEWLDRASQIAQLLYFLSIKTKHQTTYWITEANSLPTASFMNGNSGVIHFLLRYINPESFSFPLLPPILRT